MDGEEEEEKETSRASDMSLWLAVTEEMSAECGGGSQLGKCLSWQRAVSQFVGTVACSLTLHRGLHGKPSVPCGSNCRCEDSPRVTPDINVLSLFPSQRTASRCSLTFLITLHEGDLLNAQWQRGREAKEHTVQMRGALYSKKGTRRTRGNKRKDTEIFVSEAVSVLEQLHIL
ncbi:hypothetical protein F2P81_007349 [Scophthalmus maximus]|uniref:Uncharacterized protein n=1 Tax=Scophthalmus maximus TaxID=52904 RepID=A0A6A4TF22_SCOMX|nr:hypothetical protein F2P81_007349 [Scophthalmus maximus]